MCTESVKLENFIRKCYKKEDESFSVGRFYLLGYKTKSGYPRYESYNDGIKKNIKKYIYIEMSDTGKFYTNYRFECPKENVVVATSSFQDVPSNEKPLINLTMNGILRPSEEEIHIVKMIFEGDVPQKDICAQSYGTFVLCKGVYNARRIIKTAWDKETNTLEVIIDLRREKVRLKRPAQFSFSIQINDCGLQGSSCTGGGANRGGCCLGLCCKKLYTDVKDNYTFSCATCSA